PGCAGPAWLLVGVAPACLYRAFCPLVCRLYAFAYLDGRAAGRCSHAQAVAVLLPGGRCCVVRSASAADRLGIATSGSADAAGAWHPVVRPVLGVVPGLCVVLD